MKKSSFDKRLKRRITGREHLFFAVCSPGLKKVCLNEMLSSGFPKENIELIAGGIEFKARPETCMQFNLQLGSPSKILMRISRFKADSFRKLEKKLKDIDWELFLPENCYVDCRVTTKKSRLFHSDAIAQRCKTILFDRVHTNQIGSESEKKKMTQTIHIRADHDIFNISLDTSGGLLFKRGIKSKVTQAPLRENLAFAMLTWSHMTREDVLIDPMCGSGTFSLEAAMIKIGYPPGFFRSFSFETWPGFSQKTFEYLKKEAEKNFCLPTEKEIFSSDLDDAALTVLEKNIAGRDLARFIDVRKSDFFSLQPSILSPGRKGVVMINPPYGKRLGDENKTLSFYREIGKKLMADFKGWRVGVILPAREYRSYIGLNLELKPMFHGGLDIFAGIGLI